MGRKEMVETLRRVLVALDAAGDTAPAAYVQHALDILMRAETSSRIKRIFGRGA